MLQKAGYYHENARWEADKEKEVVIGVSMCFLVVYLLTHRDRGESLDVPDRAGALMKRTSQAGSGKQTISCLCVSLWVM